MPNLSPKSKILTTIFTIFFVGLFFVIILSLLAFYSPTFFGPKFLLPNIPGDAKLIFITENLNKSLAGGMLKNQWLTEAVEKGLGDLNANPAELLLFPNQKNEQGWLLFIRTMKQIDSSQLENTVKGLLASSLPTEKEKILTDGTKVTELIADPEKFNFQITNQDNLTYHSIEVPEIKFSLAYTADARGLYLAESLDSLNKVIKNNNYFFGQTLIRDLSRCPLSNFWPPKEFSLTLGTKKTFVYNYNLEKPSYGVCVAPLPAPSL